MASSLGILLLVGGLILVHEAGHLVAAKAVGLPVERFSVGFGPTLIRFRRGGTEYRLGLLPLGGYVLPVLEPGEWELPVSTGRKILFYLAGPVANLVAALGCLWLLSVGESGLLSRAAWTAPPGALGHLLAGVWGALGELIHRPSQVTGILGIAVEGGRYVGGSTRRMLELAAWLNVNLALLNALPLPPLDGGRILLALVERIHRPLRRVALAASLVGWAALLGIMAYATVLDLARLGVGGA